jgi:sulfite reductase (NADPH) flavoprotein alpha-component
MTKTGKVDKLNKLDSGPFVEIHPVDAVALDIVGGQPVELTSRRGRAVLPAVVTDRVLPGNCFVPFHWNDEHGEYLTINALTNDAVDPDLLQPEFKVCAVSLRPVKSVDQLDFGQRKPTLTDGEKIYLAAFFSGLADGVSRVPVLPASAPVTADVRLWIDGLLAGRYSRITVAVAEQPADDGPLVLWASQTGNAEEFAVRLAGKLGDSQLVNMDDMQLAELAAARDVLLITSTFGDGGPPDNGAGFWDRLHSAEAPALEGVRYAVLGIGDRSYANFCGHAKAIDGRLAALGATRILERTECEAYDDEPMNRWADQVSALVAAQVEPPSTTGHGGGVSTIARPTKVAEPFTRAKPLLAPLSRNVVLTAPMSRKEVRQFGFDISEYAVSYAVGDSLGVYATNNRATVDAWLAATGMRGDASVEVDGNEHSLRDALVVSYGICRVTPNLLRFVAESSRDKAAAKALTAPKDRLDKWLVNRNGLDIVREFAVRAEPEQWQEVLVRLTPRNYSISSSPLISPHEVQLTVSVVRYRGAGGGRRGGVCSTFLADRAAAAPVFLQRSPHFRPPEDGGTPMIMVGPGTGIAPFRGFLQERRALGYTGRNWLFFGDQHRGENFYYRDDLEDMVRDGFLNRLDLAFSRNQAERVYVQHKMLDYGADGWRWIDEGAHFYVCGDAGRMAKDVDAALTAIIRRHGSMSDEDAHDYKRELVASKRFVRDVY